MYSLQALVEAGFNIAAVVTKPDSPRGRGHKLTQPAVKVYAHEHGIEVWQPYKLLDILPDVKKLQPVVGVLVSYGRIIPEALLDMFTPGIINVHPSLLPAYRGPSPIESVILNRDNKTGITIMKLVKEMDAGPIYAQFPYALDGTETRPELYRTLAQLGAYNLASVLPNIIDGSITPSKQDSSQATYSHILTKDDTYLDLSTITPGQAEARIRAHLGFPRTRIQIGAHDLVILKAHGVMTRKTPLDLKCSNGAYLSIDSLIAPSGRTMSGEEFLRGYKVD